MTTIDAPQATSRWACGTAHGFSLRAVADIAGHRRMVSGLVWVGLGGLAAYLLLPQAGALQESLPALASASPAWLAVALLLIAVRFVATAVSLQIAVGQPIPFAPTLLVQVASAFLGRVTPEGIGWLVLNQRYLERIGLARSSAAAAVALKIVAGGMARLGVMAVVAVLAGATGLVRVDVAPASVLGAVVGGIGLLLGAKVVARRLPDRLRRVFEAASDVRSVLRQPRRAASLLAASAVITLSYPLALWASLSGVAVGASLIDITAVYLAATAVAAASPTPGNIGAVEVALSAGLTALGIPTHSAVAAVLVFRLLTFWLPILPGFIAFRYLQRRDRI